MDYQNFPSIKAGQPRIIFVTTCKGRLQHLAETLPKNLADNTGYANCKFVVLDYNSQDGLQQYLKTQHAGDIESGRLIVYTHLVEGPFQLSHAKNMAARCGILEGADILVTLDSDGFTGLNFAQFIAKKFQEPVPFPGMFLCPNFPHIKSLPHGPLRPHRGYAGRFAIKAKDFIKAGGYDETFNTWHGEDIDMISRLGRMGYQMRHIDICHLHTIPHGADVRFKEYPHAKEFETKDEWKIIDSRTTTVLNDGKIGVGVVYRNYRFDDPIDLKPVPTRIFGIGMHKTATSSLHQAFQILGFDSLHWGTGEAPRIWNELKTGDRSKTLEQFYALSDLPIPLLYQKLDKSYSGSKFVLTVRDEKDWLQSVERLWDRRYNKTRYLWDIYPFTNRIHRELYGQNHFSPQVFLERYRRHNSEVLQYFKNRPGDLLVMHMNGSTGWKALCDFLNVAEPGVPYPASNRTPIHAYKNWVVEADYCEEEAEPLAVTHSHVQQLINDIDATQLCYAQILPHDPRWLCKLPRNHEGQHFNPTMKSDIQALKNQEYSDQVEHKKEEQEFKNFYVDDPEWGVEWNKVVAAADRRLSAIGRPVSKIKIEYSDRKFTVILIAIAIVFILVCWYVISKFGGAK